MHIFVENAKSVIDIMYVIGSNGDEARKIFNKEKDIIKELLNFGSVANTKYGIIQYGKEPVVAAKFSDLSKPENVKRVLDKIQWLSDGETIVESLRVASEVFKSDSRPNSQKLIVVFTGETVQDANEELKEVVDKLAKNRVKIIPVVVGVSPDPSSLDELKPNIENPIIGRIDEGPRISSNEIGKAIYTGTCISQSVLLEQLVTTWLTKLDLAETIPARRRLTVCCRRLLLSSKPCSRLFLSKIRKTVSREVRR